MSLLNVCIVPFVLSSTTFSFCSPLFSVLEDRIWRHDFWSDVTINKTRILKESVITTATNGVIDHQKTLEHTLRKNGQWSGKFHIETNKSKGNSSFHSSRDAKFSSFKTVFSHGFSRALYVDADVLIMKPILKSVIAQFLDTTTKTWDDRCDIYVQRPSSNGYILNSGIIVADNKRSVNITERWRHRVLTGKFTTDQEAFESLSLINGITSHRRNHLQSTYCYLPNDVEYITSFNLNIKRNMPSLRKNICTFFHFKGKTQKILLKDLCDKREWPCDVF